MEEEQVSGGAGLRSQQVSRGLEGLRRSEEASVGDLYVLHSLGLVREGGAASIYVGRSGVQWPAGGALGGGGSAALTDTAVQLDHSCFGLNG